MTRLEIANKLYDVASRINKNADKYIRGDILTNDDWKDIGIALEELMPYLMNSSSSPEELEKRLPSLIHRKHGK